jgi:hypothetical protein
VPARGIFCIVACEEISGTLSRLDIESIEPQQKDWIHLQKLREAIVTV